MTIGYLPEKETVDYLRHNFSKKEINIGEEIARYMICVTTRSLYKRKKYLFGSLHKKTPASPPCYHTTCDKWIDKRWNNRQDKQ